MEMSTLIREGSNAVIVLLNNDGYATERAMTDGPFNDLAQWSYAELPACLGGKNMGVNMGMNAPPISRVNAPTAADRDRYPNTNKHAPAPHTGLGANLNLGHRLSSCVVRTEQQFFSALEEAFSQPQWLCFIEAVLPQNDMSTGLRNITRVMGHDVAQRT